MLVTTQYLQKQLPIETSHHNIATARRQAFVYEHQIAIEDAEPLQAIACYAHHVELRAVQLKKLIEGDTLLKMILGRTRESCWNGWQVEREGGGRSRN